MKWMRERDLLIAQTMAFVQSVTGNKPDAEKRPRLSAATVPLHRGLPAMPDIEAMLAEAIATPRACQSPCSVSRAGRSAANTRTKSRPGCNFRAHQQRFLQEREDYCSPTMAKVQKALNNLPPPRLNK